MSGKLRDKLLAPFGAPRGDERRRIHYVDERLQKWLLVALVVMECTLIGLAMWSLYGALSGIIEENLYRIHFSEQSELLPRFLMKGTQILIGIGVVNLLAIILADRIWALYVESILRRLDMLTEEARQLDFSERSMPCTHAVLAQAMAWRRSQAQRMRKLRAGICTLPAALPERPEERSRAGKMLEKIRETASSRTANPM